MVIDHGFHNITSSSANPDFVLILLVNHMSLLPAPQPLTFFLSSFLSLYPCLNEDIRSALLPQMPTIGP